MIPFFLNFPRSTIKIYSIDTVTEITAIPLKNYRNSEDYVLNTKRYCSIQKVVVIKQEYSEKVRARESGKRKKNKHVNI